jgi:hypothetical protein
MTFPFVKVTVCGDEHPRIERLKKIATIHTVVFFIGPPICIMNKYMGASYQIFWESAHKKIHGGAIFVSAFRMLREQSILFWSPTPWSKPSFWVQTRPFPCT